MERGQVSVRSGDEYTPLFPVPNFRDTTVKKEAEVEDTIKLIRDKVVPQTVWQVEKIAKKLKGKDLEDTCSRIWHFVYNHIAYRKDEEGTEQIRSPARSWWERKSGKGVDCDCYSVFISTILTHLKIPHKYRITKYPVEPPFTPRWQHIYIVVPIDGDLSKDLNDKEDYITIDCVKNQFDSEQWYLEKKDFNAKVKDMKLDYLDGLDEEYIIPQSQDVQDLVGTYDEEELGKIGNWAKKAVKNVSKVAKVVAAPITKPLATSIKIIKDPKHAGKIIKSEIKKAGGELKEGVHIINQVTNPGAMLIRKGFLIAMKNNLFNIAKRMRYSYMNDEQALSHNMDIAKLNDVRKIRDKAEGIYYTIGGEKSAMAKAIIEGKGNKDKKVALAGLYGFGEVYADEEEYNIIHSPTVSGFGQLGEPATAASIAAATTVLTALAASLGKVKGLFKPNSPEEKNFASDKDEEIESVQPVSTQAYTEPQQQVVAEPIPSYSEQITTENYSFPAPSAAASFAPPSSYAVPTSVAPQASTMRIQTDSETSEDIETPSLPEIKTEINPIVPQKPVMVLPKTTDPQEPWYKKNSKLLIGASIVVVGGYFVYSHLKKEGKGEEKKQAIPKGAGFGGVPKQKKKANTKSTSKGKVKGGKGKFIKGIII